MPGVVTSPRLVTELAGLTLPNPVGLAAGFDKDGAPTGTGWDSLPIPGAESAGAFALSLSGGLYREGDVVIASAAAARRKGDRILVIHPDDRVETGFLAQETATSIHLKGGDGKDMPVIKRNGVRLVARILWLAQ